MKRHRANTVRLQEPDDHGSLGQAGTDPATKRRMRNRMSQRNLRERKSVYIKELEELSRIAATSESDRNKHLVQEATELRAAMLKIRSQVHSLSMALNSIGTTIGSILDVENLEVPREWRESPMNADQGNSNDPSARVATEPAIEGGHTGQPRNDVRTPSYTEHSLVEEDTTNAMLPTSQQPTASSENSIDGQTGRAHISFSREEVQNSSIAEYATVPPKHQACSSFMMLTSQPVSSRAAVDQQEVDFLQLIGNGIGCGTSPESNQQIDILADSTSMPRSSDGWIPLDTSCPDFNSCVTGSQPPGSDPWSNGSVSGTDLTLPNLLLPFQAGLSFPPGLLPPAKGGSSNPTPPMQSMLSEHMEALEKFVRCQLDLSPAKPSYPMLAKYCLDIMSLFGQTAWPPSYTVWFKSQAPEIVVSLLFWRLHPTADAYNRLLPQYQPTELQLTVPHSPIIDWLPDARMRDQALLRYNNSVILDWLICDILHHYVVEIDDVSSVISGAEPGRGYFGVWNLFSIIDSPDTAAADLARHSPVRGPLGVKHNRTRLCMSAISGAATLNTASQDLPNLCPSDEIGDSITADLERSRSQKVYEVLTTPALALKLSRDIRLYATKRWKLDPSFFVIWPDLAFDGHEELVAKGRSYRISDPMPPPTPLSAETVARYRNSLESMVVV